MQVQQLEAQVTALQGQLAACRTKKASAETELRSLNLQRKSNATEVNKNDMAIARFTEQEAELLQRIEQIVAECDLSPDEQNQVRYYSFCGSPPLSI